VTATRSRWERHLIRGIRISDAVVVAVAIAVAHVVRYVILPVTPEALLLRGPSFLQISLTLYVGWMIALAVFRTRDPKVLDSGMRQYQAIARATFTLFA